MRRACLCVHAVALLPVFLPAGRLSAQDGASQASVVQSQPNSGSASLRICLRLQDDSPFSGAVSVRVMPNEGYEVSGAPTGSDGEMIFSDMPPGAYIMEASAPGFLTVRQKIQIEPGHRRQILFVIMKPRPLSIRVPEMPVASPPAGTAPERTSWIPAGLDEVIPEVDPNVECPLPEVVRGAGERMKQLVDNLEKFSASERVEHFPIDREGVRHSADVRNFEYVVVVSQNSGGTFLLDEYRNGGVDPTQFPAGIATQGLPGMALIFHPVLAPDFKFACEGLGQWEGNPAWQVHFLQRADRPIRIRAYWIGGKYAPVPLKGRAWIDPGTYQVLRLESELVNPIKEIELTEEHLSIEYAPVQFHTQNQRLWLPQTADLYVERQGRRYYRRHTFTNFKIFTVQTTQNIQPPKQSYSFTNMSDRDIAGVLTVAPVAGAKLEPVSIEFTIPAGGSIFKLVGQGKDVNLPVESVGSATFTHNGATDAVKVEAYLVKESTLDVIPETAVPVKP